MVLQCDWAQIQVIVLTNDGNGFGFGISGSRNSGAVVRNIFPGGAADRDGTLRNGDHLLAVGDVRLWGMGAEQVASILRQAGQDSIRLVVARPVDPSVPQFALNSTIVPTKLLTDPQGLNQALQSGLQAVNGFTFDAAASSSSNAAAASAASAAAATAANGVAYPEAYQTIMDVLPAEMPSSAFQDFPPAAEPLIVPPPPQSRTEDEPSSNIPTIVTTPSTSLVDNVALPPTSKSVIEAPAITVQETIVTHLGTKATTTVLSPATVTSEAVIQVHNSSETSNTACQAAAAPVGSGGHRVAIVTNESQPNKISIIPSDQLQSSNASSASNKRLDPPRDPGGESITNNDEPAINNSDEDLPEKEEYKIELHKDMSKGLGITIAGYVCEKEDLCGIFVKSIIEDSVADKSGCIMVNDQITEVNGASLSGKTNQEAVEILKNTDDIVYLTIVRYLRGLKFEELQEGIKVANVPTPTSPYAQTPVSEVKMPLQPPGPPLSAMSSSAGANSTSVTVSSLSRPSSSSVTSCSSRASLARGSPHSKSLKLEEPPKSLPRRSVPNVLEDAASMKTKVDDLVLQQQNNVGSSTSTIVVVDKDALQLKWESTMGSKYTIVIAKLRKPDASSGLGISLEGTVDVEDGVEVRPHHYIRSILPGGPIGLNGVLRSGDELLEVNDKCLKGLFHEEVVKSLKELPVYVCLVCARKVTGPSPLRGTIVDNVDPGHSEQAFASRKILSGSLQSLLASKEPELLPKAKSEVSLACTTSQSLSVELSTAAAAAGAAAAALSSKTNKKISKQSSKSTTPVNTPLTPVKLKSRSLEHLNCQAMWKDEVEEIVLTKSDRGLGFSILDYQDPLNMSDTVIVVRSLVPGGVAQVDGRIVPGDRIMYVNSIILHHASLDTAVQALKGAAFGPVKIGIARPVMEENNEAVMNQLRERLSAADNTANTPLPPSTEDSVPCSSLSDNTIGESNISDLKTDIIAGDEEDGLEDMEAYGQGCHGSANDNGCCLESSALSSPPRCLPGSDIAVAQGIQILPHLPKYSICIKKGPSGFLGIQLEALAFELCGTIIRQVEVDSCVARDGRLKPGDLILYLNHECLWRVTSSQAKTILRRAELVSNAIPIIFVPEECLVASEESSEDDPSDQDLSCSSPSESLKLSQIQEETLLYSSPEEILPDLTVQSAKTLASSHLKRFPSDLLESSVDPVLPPLSNNPKDFQETQSSTLTETEEEQAAKENLEPSMVRVYNQPTVTHRGQTPTSSVHLQPQPLNGFQSSGPGSSSTPSSSAASGEAKVWGPQREVEVKRVEGKSLGLSIVGGKVDGVNSGIFVKNVLPDSPAGATGQLFTGDRILQVGNVTLTSSEQKVAVEAIKNSGDPIRLVVQSLQPSSSKQRCLEELDVLDQMSRLSIDPFQHNRRLSETNLLDLKCQAHNDTCPTRSESHSVAQSPPPHLEKISLLSKDYKEPDNPFQNDALPLWENKKRSPKPAEKKTGTPFNSHSNISSPDNNNYGGQQQAYRYRSLNETPTSPELANHRMYQGASSSPPPSPEIIQPGLSDVERQKMQHRIDAEFVEKRDQHLTVLKQKSIDRIDDDMELESSISVMDDHSPKPKSAKSIKDLKREDSSSEEEDADAIDDDINRQENFRKLGGDVVEIDLKRNDFGFGLALAGHSNRNRMGTFICGIHPQGAAFENGQLRVGDELLKIHKTVVRGRSHLNVSAIMKKVPNDLAIKVVALRHNSNLEKIAVKKFTQFPVKLDDVIFDSQEFECFLGKREIKMQKTTEGLGIMIIEGSHKTLGKGIFISDIQQNSLAFKASLKVGDMILAVNTESFLDISYDEAALVLKQVTGNVRVLVVNPKDEEDKRKEAKEASPTSATTATTAGTGTEAKKATLSPDSAATPASDCPKAGAPKNLAKSVTPTKPDAKSPSKTPAKSPGKSPAKKDDNSIELKKDANGLGLSIVGGSDTTLGGVIVHEVYKDGAADKDGRIKPGDMIVTVDGKAMKECTHKDALRVLRVTKDKVKIVIDPKHDSADLYQDIDTELIKKSGKGLGLSVVGRREGNGVFISDMVVGGTAESNGQLMRGDQIMKVNEQDLSEAKQDQAVAVLKTASGVVQIRVRRYKSVVASSSS